MDPHWFGSLDRISIDTNADPQHWTTRAHTDNLILPYWVPYPNSVPKIIIDFDSHLAPNEKAFQGHNFKHFKCWLEINSCDFLFRAFLVPGKSDSFAVFIFYTPEIMNPLEIYLYWYYFIPCLCFSLCKLDPIPYRALTCATFLTVTEDLISFLS